MANFSELSGIKQWAVVMLGGAAVSAALFFTVFKSQSDKNAAAQHALEDKIRENNELESFRPKLKLIDQQLAELKQQLEIEQRIVPDEKQVDGFITMMDGEAQRAGVAQPAAGDQGPRRRPGDDGQRAGAAARHALPPRPQRRPRQGRHAVRAGRRRGGLRPPGPPRQRRRRRSGAVIGGLKARSASEDFCLSSLALRALCAPSGGRWG